ncbi:MAG: S46 family peptidase, partial [Flavobacteriales bacterium]|nr:S46 family peptidase [Flavobacteriales bacterium]
TISVDIRYVLWVIDKYAGAGHLVKEMDLVIGQPEEPAKAEAEAKEDMKKEVEKVAN